MRPILNGSQSTCTRKFWLTKQSCSSLASSESKISTRWTSRVHFHLHGTRGRQEMGKPLSTSLLLSYCCVTWTRRRSRDRPITYWSGLAILEVYPMLCMPLVVDLLGRSLRLHLILSCLSPCSEGRRSINQRAKDRPMFTTRSSKKPQSWAWQSSLKAGLRESQESAFSNNIFAASSLWNAGNVCLNKPIPRSQKSSISRNFWKASKWLNLQSCPCWIHTSAWCWRGWALGTWVKPLLPALTQIHQEWKIEL